MSEIWDWVRWLFNDPQPKSKPAEAEPRWVNPPASAERYGLLIEMAESLGDPRWRALAAQRLRNAAAPWTGSEWARVEDELRARSAHYYRMRAEWVRGGNQVRHLTLPPGTEAAVLGILSMHPNGYAREAAVQRLAQLGDGSELPPLLLRAVDFVPQVRARADAALAPRVVPAYVRAWVRALPLVLRLRMVGDHALVHAVMALLRQPASRDALFEGLSSPDMSVRRNSFRLLREHGAEVLHALVREALRSPDPQLRLWAARAAGELDQAALDDVLPAMLRDRLGPVRMAALRLGAGRMGDAALPGLRRALLDRSPRVREDARAVLARMRVMDVAAFYRERVRVDDARLPAAIAGLGEMGDSGDAALLVVLASHPRARVRTAAVRALGRLAESDAAPVLVRALGDPSGAVSGAARDALRGNPARDGAELGAWLAAGNPPHVRRNALTLLVLRGTWDALPWILHALAADDPEVRTAAGLNFRRWRERSDRASSQPSPSQRQRIIDALRVAAPRLRPEDDRWLRFVSGID